MLAASASPCPVIAVPALSTPFRNSVTVTATLFRNRSEEHTSELQSRSDLVCRLLLEKKKKHKEPPKERKRILHLAPVLYTTPVARRADATSKVGLTRANVQPASVNILDS